MHENNLPGQIQLSDPDAIAHSDRLQTLICEQIQKQGPMPFHQYMAQALYAPGLGYYTAGSQKFGNAGDFVTAPEISFLFSQALANQCAQVLSVQTGDILEFGAGSGVMAAHILKHLMSLGKLPGRYLILDLSPDLQQRQRQTIEAIVPEFIDRVEWLQALPENFSGVILANEVLDAMPVSVFRKRSGSVEEQFVNVNDDGMQLIWQQASAALLEAVAQLEQRYGEFADGYMSEINLNLQGWLSSIGEMLHTGVVILIDYGYNGFEYYHPERYMGTLICHYQHRAHDDPMILPGLQDITANVDFSAVANAARQSGLALAGYTPQANFLLSCGIEQLIADYIDTDEKKFLQLSQAMKVLMLPSEMGERFKVLALSKNFNQALIGFAMRDLSGRL